MRARRPGAERLASLGTVLCMHPGSDLDLLLGYRRASSALLCARITSDGPREWLSFRTIAGTECWRLYLLPDTDLYGWDRLAATLETSESPEPGDNLAERFWKGLVQRLRDARWSAAAVQFHARPSWTAPAASALCMRAVALSPLGSAVAQHLVRHAELDRLAAPAPHARAPRIAQHATEHLIRRQQGIHP